MAFKPTSHSHFEHIQDMGDCRHAERNRLMGWASMFVIRNVLGLGEWCQGVDRKYCRVGVGEKSLKQTVEWNLLCYHPQNSYLAQKPVPLNLNCKLKIQTPETNLSGPNHLTPIKWPCATSTPQLLPVPINHVKIASYICRYKLGTFIYPILTTLRCTNYFDFQL